MTLVGAILEKVKSNTSVTNKKYFSPPPEIVEIETVIKKKRKKYVDKFAHIRPKVDTSAPLLDPTLRAHHLPGYLNCILQINHDNMALVAAIKKVNFSRGKVDCRWEKYPERTLVKYYNRVNFYKHVVRENKKLYKSILERGPKVVTTADLRHDWALNRRRIIEGAEGKFVLFPPVPRETLEDEAFAPPLGVTRPRVYISVRVRGYAEMGVMTAELFPDVCPATCRLFTDLLDGDGLGFGYVGTRFFRKVPGMYWSGGDVSHDNGFGCYAQRGRNAPIGAENYHFSHSMPGLLSMRVTKDDEMCGIFNITFKPLPQFDLRNVVFGRIVRPCTTYDSISKLGSPMSSWPIVEICRTRRRRGDGWVTGQPNTRIVDVQKLYKERCV